MFIQSLPICYNQVHSLLPTDAASNQQALDPEESISKIINRAILRKTGVDVDLWNEYSLQRCYCKAQGGQDQDGKQLEGLGVAQGGSLFIQKIEKKAKGARVLSAVHICYDSSHQPFATEGAVRIEDLDSERSASKIIRAVIRSNGIEAASWESYSLHRCYCNSHTKIKDRRNELLKSELTLKELEIRDGESVFIRIRKIDDGLVEMKKEQSSNSRRSSKKRKERADDESPHSHSQKVSPREDFTSRKRRSTSDPPKSLTAVDETSNLENLSSKAAESGRTISKLLGGDDWKIQSIGKLGNIQTRGTNQLQGLVRLVKTSLQIPQLSKSDRSGLFNSDLIEALTRAYYQRISSSMAEMGQNNFLSLGLSDYERANVLLKSKIEQDGSWERSSISHLDESALSKPSERYPLRDSGLSGHRLNTARDISACWNNDKWINQSPLPGLSPISLKSNNMTVTLRQIAQLTRVKPGEATPGGFPSIVLRALQEAIKQRESMAKPLIGPAAAAGWSQSKGLATALEILKEELGSVNAGSSASTSVNSGKTKKRRTGKELK